MDRRSSISTHMNLPQHLSKKLRGCITFRRMSFGMTLALTTIGFGMFWFDVTMGPKTPTRPHPLPLRKALSHPAESLLSPQSSATTQTVAPSSNFSNTTHKKTSPTKQILDTKKPTRTPEIGPFPLSKPDRLIGQSRSPNVQRNFPRLSATSSRNVDDKQKQKSLRSTTITQAITNNTSTPLSASPPTQKENHIPPPSELGKTREILQPDKKTVHMEKHVTHKASTSRSSTPISPEDRLAQGRSYVRQQRYLEAVETLEPLFVSPPEEWEPWFWMGTAQMGLMHYEVAMEAFREGLTRDETIPQLWVQWAIVEQQRGKFSRSLDRLRQAELLAPTLPEVQLNLAYSLENLGHTRPALEYYRRYLSLTDHNPLHLSTRKKVLDRILYLEKS